MEQHPFSTAETLSHAAIYFLLFLAGDLSSSLIFDGLFSVITFQSWEWYVILRMTGCLLVTWGFFRLYTEKRLHLKMEDSGTPDFSWHLFQ